MAVVAPVRRIGRELNDAERRPDRDEVGLVVALMVRAGCVEDINRTLEADRHVDRAPLRMAAYQRRGEGYVIAGDHVFGRAPGRRDVAAVRPINVDARHARHARRVLAALGDHAAPVHEIGPFWRAISRRNCHGRASIAERLNESPGILAEGIDQVAEERARRKLLAPLTAGRFAHYLAHSA